MNLHRTKVRAGEQKQNDDSDLWSYYSALSPMSSPTPAAPPNARQSLREAKRALYRATILDAAEAAFARAGYDATKVQTIAREAGISLATLYGVFPKKWDIFRALQHDRLTQLMQGVLPQGDPLRDPFDRLQFGITAYLTFHMKHPRFLEVQLREGVPWGTTDELRTPEQTRAWEAGLALMTQAFADGMRGGVFIRDDPELCARTATAMSQVRLALWVGQPQPPAPEVVARKAMSQLIRTFAAPDRVAQLTQRVLQSPDKDASLGPE